MENSRLNLNEVRYLIVHKPLVIVKLDHSSYNKQLITKALASIWKKHPQGQKIFKVLREFLSEVAPKYAITPAQNGVREFLLREMDRLSGEARPVSAWSKILNGLGMARVTA